MKKIFLPILLLTIVSISSANTPPIAASCVGCHGPNGISMNNLWPNLAGQKKDYLLKQLKAFKYGERKDPMMTPLMLSLSDADLEKLADYYSNLKGAQ
jgi:cytochrome c553